MIFLKKPYNHIYLNQNNLMYSIKLFNDFIFFNYLIKEYIKLHISLSLYSLTIFIYLLNILAIKYILFASYSNIFHIISYLPHKIYILELFYWKNKNIVLLNNKSLHIIEQKILLIKKISRTREKGRIRRYKVIILIGNRTGWFGIGYSKNYYLQEAISNARLHAFKNIYHIPIFYSKLFKNNIYIQKKVKKLYLFSSKYKIQTSVHYVLRVLFDFIGLTNISSKIIGTLNIYNILALILKI